MMSRQFLNLVANSKSIKGCCPAYTLHRIDPSTFFFHTPAEAAAAAAARSAAAPDDLEKFELPPATMTFRGTCQSEMLEPDLHFISFGANNSSSISLLALDGKGRTILCDAASPTPAISPMPSLHACKSDPISLPVGDKVYVMDSIPGGRHSFEALIHGRGSRGRSDTDWYWHSLPLPPHVRPPKYTPYISDVSDDDALDYDDYEYQDSDIDGHTVVGDSQILISTRFGRTYSFDTARLEWRKKAMDWSLPFTGRAEYVPELNLWFGISYSEPRSEADEDEDEDNRLCAFDMAGAGRGASPVLRGVWEDVPQLRKWTLIKSNILPLGSGKLLIAKFFHSKEKVMVPKCGDWFYKNFETFAVLAGVELLEEPGGGLRMVKHRSKRYDHRDLMPDWII